MTRRSLGRCLTALGAVFVVVVLLTATPLGVWLAAGVAERAAASWGWQLRIGGSGGAIVTAPRLRDLHARHVSSGVDVEVVELIVDPWAWRLTLKRPQARWQPPEKAGDPAPARSVSDTLRLPLARLPAIDIEAGTFTIVSGHEQALRVWLEGVGGHLVPAAEGTGDAQLELAVESWTVDTGTPPVTGEARTRWRLSPTAVQLTEAWVRFDADSLGAGTIRGKGKLDLAPGLAAEAQVTVEGEAAGLTAAWADASAAGTLAPLRLAVQARGEGQHSWLGDLTIDAAGHVDTAVVRIDSARLGVATGALVLKGELLAGTAQADGRIDGVQLSQLPLGSLDGRVRGRWRISGPLARPTAQLSLTTDALRGIAPEAVDLTVDGTLTAAGALRLSARSQRLGQLAGDGDLSLETGRYDLSLKGRLDAGAWLGRPLPTMVRGRLRPDTLDARLSAAALPFGDDPPGPVTADVVLHRFRDLEASLQVGTGQLSANLRADLSSGVHDTLSARVHGLQLSHLSAGTAGRASGRATATGKLGLGSLGGVRLAVDDLGLAGWGVGPATLSADFDGGKAHLEASAKGVQLRAEVDTTGGVRVEAVLQGAALRAPDPGRAGGGMDSVRVTGRLDGHGNLGDLASGGLSVRLDVVEASLGGWPLRLEGSSSLTYDEHRGHLSDTRVRTPLGVLQLRGRTNHDSLDATATVDSLAAAGLEAASVRGRASLRLGGTQTEPTVRLQVDLDELAFGDRPLGALSASLDLSDSLRGALELRAAEAAEPSLVIDLTAPAADFLPRHVVAGPQRARLRVSARDLDASPLATYALHDSTGLRVSLEAELWLPTSSLLGGGLQLGDLDGSIEMGGLTVDRDRVRLRLTSPAMARLFQGTATVDGFDLPVEVYRSDSDVYEASGSIGLEGRLAGDGGGVQLRLQDVDLAAVAMAVPGRISLPVGTISATARWTGTAETPALEASAEADLEDLGWLRAHAFGRPNNWKANATWVTPVEDSLVVTASAPSDGTWPAWDASTIEAHSAGIDLLVLLDQIPQLETLAGKVRVDVKVDSLAAQPRVAGEVAVEDLELALLGVKPGYRFPEGRLVFSPAEGGGSRGELVGFDGGATKGQGRIQLQGWVEVTAPDEADYELRLATENLPYHFEDVFEAPEVDIDLSLRSEPGGSLLAGSVRLADPFADIQLVDLTAPPVPPPPAVQNELLESTRLDVYVDVDRLQTRSELSDIQLEGQVRVYGTFYKPRFQGELEVIEGAVIVLSREFSFTSGRVIVDRLVPTHSILDLIDDPVLLDPELDLEAVAHVQPRDDTEEEREVTLAIRGPAQSAVPQLTSPGLGNVETLSLLAFGSTNSDKFDYSGALYTAAGQLLLSRQVQRVGLDEFLLLPSGTALGTVGQSSIRVGKFLSWPLPIWVRYEAITRDPSLGQFEIEYRITKWLELDATAHSQYELYGLGVGVSRDF